MKIAIFGSQIYPSQKEAIAKQYSVLANILKADRVSFNEMEIVTPLETIYLSKFKIIRKIQILRNWKSFEKKYDMIIFHSHINSPLLKRIDRKKYVHFVSSVYEEKEMEKYLKNFAKDFKKILVQKKSLFERIKHIPGAIFSYPVTEIKVTLPKNKGDFNFLFASAPHGPTSTYEEKGVNLLLDAFAKIKEGKLTILWRGKYSKRLREEVSKNPRKDDIDVIDGEVDIKKMFEKSNAVVIPYTSTKKGPDYPSSAIEALAYDREVVCTNVIEMGQLLQENNIGEVSDPNPEALAEAMKKCMNNKNDNRIIYEKVFAPAAQKLKEELIRE